MLALCDAYRFGDGMARDRLEFVRWAKAAALAGDETGLEYLHQAFYLYHDVDLRPYCNAAALAELKAAGNGPSLYVLGKLAYTEFGASQGLCEDDAFSYWFQAAKMGYGPAEMDLGFILGEKNPKAQAKQAFAYIRDAAEQGEVRAMYPLADMYYKGKGTEPDLMASFDWVQAAAAQGEPNACLLLGLSYLSTDERYSRYVVQDHDRAVAYFKEAAAGGNLSGMSTYGIAKVMNRTCAEDAYEGLQYMETAYRLGDKNIGDILALVKKDSSLGVPKVN
ncbi:tetratricopeptide repeat protein, partial [uncultured Megasphaera sp.]|uniref:tetratricopeptide repeat protein n=1 Tax=uncultured Megasphaera sp. TaxID=165188 RepID=UPI0034A07089